MKNRYACIALLTAAVFFQACGGVSTDSGNPSLPGPNPEPNFPGDPNGPSVQQLIISAMFADALCNKIAECASSETIAPACWDFVRQMTNIDTEVGLPEHYLPSYADIIQAEFTHDGVTVNDGEANQCWDDLSTIACTSDAVQGVLAALEISGGLFNPSDELSAAVVGVFPTQAGSCPQALSPSEVPPVSR